MSRCLNYLCCVCVCVCASQSVREVLGAGVQQGQRAAGRHGADLHAGEQSGLPPRGSRGRRIEFPRVLLHALWYELLD
jgi:hypothetical protein